MTFTSFHMEASVAADPDLAAEVVKAMGMMHQHLGLIAKIANGRGDYAASAAAAACSGDCVEVASQLI